MTRAALTALALAAALAPAAARAGTRTVVVAIGNDVGNADEVMLRFAERDAEAFGALLRRLGGVRPEDMVVVTGGNADDVRGVLDDVAARLAKEGGEADTALIVYYSGHADATGLHLADTVLPYDELEARVTEARAGARVLLLDSCRSGGVTRVKGARPAEAFDLRLDTHLEVEGLAVLTSSTATEDSQESDALGGSFFTHHLLGGLRGAADADHDGRVTLSEVHDYVYRNTLRSSGRTEQLQHPTYAYDMRGRGELVLTRLADAHGGRLQLAESDTYLIRSGGEAGALILEVHPEGPNARVALPPGRYFVQQRRPDHFVETEVELAPGREVVLADQPHRAYAYAHLVRKGGAAMSQSVFVLATAETSALEGGGLVPGATLRWAAEFPWLTLGLRGHFGRREDTLDGLERVTQTFGADVSVEHVVDLPVLSLSLGVLAGGRYAMQTFETQLDADDRRAFTGGFGVQAAVERALGERFALRLEGGPYTQILQVATNRNGAESTANTTSRLTFWLGFGVGGRF